MRTRISAARFGLAATFATLNVGCNWGPPRVPAPSWDPDRIAARALEELDKNADGAVDEREAQAAPGFAEGFARLDADSDARVTAAEIQTRIALYKKMRTGLISRSFTVLIEGRPKAGVRVEFAPEPFVGDLIKPAVGVTRRGGSIKPQTVGQDLPAMQVGYYRVNLYASETATEPLPLAEPVGVEVSPVAEVDADRASVLRFSAG